MHSEIDARIHQIAGVLENNGNLPVSMTLKDGLLGLSLFYVYYYQYTGDKRYVEKITEYLERTFDGLTGNRLKEFEPVDLVDLGRYLIFLKEKDLLEEEEVRSCIGEIETYICEVFAREMEQENLETVLGVIGIGHYFAEGMVVKDYSAMLSAIVGLLEQKARYNKEEADSIYWYYQEAKNKQVDVIRFGITNGLAGIIYFLLCLYKKNIQPEVCAVLIEKAVNYLFQNQVNKKGISIYPYGLPPEPRILVQSIAYGDIGIGNVLYKAGHTFNNQLYVQEGIKVIENAGVFRDDTGKFVRDAPLLHGAAGLFSLFDTYTRETQSETIAGAAAYWLKRVLEFNTTGTPWAGYNSYYNGYSNHYQISFAYGLAGIGISLMAHEKCLTHDYLRFFNC